MRGQKKPGNRLFIERNFRPLRLRQEYRASHGNPAGCFFCPGFRGFLSPTVPVYVRHRAQYHQNPRTCIPCPKSRCQFILLFIVICGITISKNNGDILSPFLLSHRMLGFFICQKEAQMKTPEFLRQIMSSPAYMDKSSKVYATAENI